MLNSPAKTRTVPDSLIARRDQAASLTRPRPLTLGLPPQFAEAYRNGTISRPASRWIALGFPVSMRLERRTRGASLAAAGASSLLEPKKNNVTQPSHDRVMYLCPTGCGRSACPNCSRKIGLEVRNNLIARIRSICVAEGWGFDQDGDPRVAINMWTFTCDPKLGLSSEELYDRESQRKYISKIAARFGWKYWVAAVEWQKSGMPHWHVLHLGRDKNDVYTDWSRVSDAWPLGNVQFSATNKTAASGKAANAVRYVTKYMTKGKDEDHGPPEWVMDRAGMRMFRASRAVGALRRKRPGPERPSVNALDMEEETATIRQNNRKALADCGTTVTILLQSVQAVTGAMVYEYKTLADFDWKTFSRWAKNRAKTRQDWDVTSRRARIPIDDEKALTWLFEKSVDGPPKDPDQNDHQILTRPGISPMMCP